MTTHFRRLRGIRNVHRLARAVFYTGAMALLVHSVSACTGDEADALSGAQDPKYYRNEGGALKLYRGVQSLFQTESVRFLQTTGVLTDEMNGRDLNAPRGALINTVDLRILPVGNSPVDDYNLLQSIRGNAIQTIGFLTDYAPAQSPALRGEVYAIEGYAEIYLADLFCSGIPLSVLEYKGDYIYKVPSTTAGVYEHAIALFDTAITLSADSARALNLARIGRGRALLALGRYSEAATAVADVPNGFSYQFPVAWSDPASHAQNFTTATVADHEGTNGLPYVSSGDPRTTVVPMGNNLYNVPMFFPAKFGDTAATSPLVVGDWIEATLIRAEAALQAGQISQWLSLLNDLRANGGYAGLIPLTDPGALLSGAAATRARVDLLFEERAYWLFATGHRQGDLRRLIREYDRSQQSVYPIGPYPGGAGVYGGNVNIPVPETERQNPNFTGCIDRNA